MQILSDHALINRFPTEVLSRIFEHGVHHNNLLVNVLSRVSRHWRTVALETPTLWSYFRLNSDWNYGRGEEFVRMIEMHAKRSQAASILVDLDFRFCESLDEAESFMTALHPHLSRCYSFRVSVVDWSWMEVVAKFTDGMEGCLEEFALSVDPEETEGDKPIPVLKGVYSRLVSVVLEQAPLQCVFAKAKTPSLRRLNVIRHPRYHANQRIRIPLREYLSALTASDAPINSVQLQSVSFHLDGTESLFQHPQSASLTKLPHLTSLVISHVDATNMCLFFDSVDLPRLERIAIQMDSGHESENLSWLEHLASASDQGRLSSLYHLEMRACATEDAVLGPIVGAFHRLSQLSQLGISMPPSGHIGTRLFQALCNPSGVMDAWLLPRLEVLSLFGCRDLTGHEVLRVVQTRRRADPGSGVARVRMVRLVPLYPLDPDVLDTLRENLEELRLMR